MLVFLMVAIYFAGCIGGGERETSFGEKPRGQESGKGWIYGRIIEKANGSALSNASVVIDEAPYSAKVDSGGAYSIENIEPGWYTVRAMADGYKDEISYIEVKAGEGMEINLAQTAFYVYTHEYAKTGDLPTALFFSPHPDDGQISSGGAECDHVAKGDRVVEVFTGSGVTGSDFDAAKQAESLNREGEAKNATAAIGVDELVFMRFPNGGVKYNGTTFFNAVKYMIEKYHPYVIYTAEFSNTQYTHPDHTTTGITVFSVVESLNWSEKPTIRFYGTEAPFDWWEVNCNFYIDITQYIYTLDQAIAKHQSQTSSIYPALTIKKVSYLENGYRAGKPGSLCEGYREVKLAPGICKIYDFNGITKPSSTHVAWYKHVEDAPDDGPPTSGPEVSNSTEFTEDMYRAIWKLDDIEAETRAWVSKRVHNFKFVIDETPDQICELHVRWKGYAEPSMPSAYIWNFQSKAWELIGTINNDMEQYSPSDQDIEDFVEKTYTGNFSNYINESGCVYLSAINARTDVNGVPNDGNRIDTDYVRVRVTLKA